mmetsp:Transcript_2923/g.2841  ORF Transcript_2923/g.2841 Transcript_2923/m.2841 type:complete len:939 (+) Transcript_2923:125-2941(+)
MFSRRQNRSVHGTSYTGVNPAASGSNQPNNNALAAALSIGKSLKQQGAPGVHATNGGSNQYLSKPPQKRNSLLKRDSITRSPNSNRFRNFSDASYNSTNSHSLQTPPQSMQRRSSIQRHNLDDSFDDSYYDDTNQDATQSYNNAKMRDLRLSHQLSPPPSRNGQVHQDNGTVKMVKKYIPTPNGIKIIEVPETVYQKEVARNNSMRSMPRSGSMTSLSQKRIPRSPSLSSVSGATKKASHQRLSSFGRSPALGTMAESEEIQSRRRYNEDSELQRLQQQIDHEKQVSKDLELKRLEYEKVKLERLENEKKILVLKKEAANNKDIDVSEVIDEDDEEEDVPLPNILVIVDEVENKRLEQNGELDTNKNVAIEKPSLGEINDMSKDEDISAEDDTSIYEEEAIPDASIDASSVVVDELEKKNKEGDDAYDIGSSEHLQNGFRNDQGAAELNVISQYSDSKEILNRDSIIDNPIPVSTDEEDFGIEELPYDKSEEGNLAKHLRPTFDSQSGAIDSKDSGPKFDPQPEIIGANETIHLGESNQDMVHVDDPIMEELAITTLKIPTSSLNNDSSSSSAQSAASLDSNTQLKSEKRPFKSAMKNSSSFYNNSSSNSSTVKNAAQDAYLSLATAENTRLNSKLSSTQLNDAGSQFNKSTSQNSPQLNNQYQEIQPNQTKRISTLRKSPSTQSPGLASRSLRPQSMVPESPLHSNQHHPSVNGMGNRKLRDRTSAHVNPTRDRASYSNQISPHPALQPNYQSPSKTKAAELYAKANARPTSSFAPVTAKKNSDVSAKQQAQKAHRTTLRDMSSPNQGQRAESTSNNTPQNANETSSSPVENHKAFKSRLADSDEEEGHEGKSKFFGGGFSSRFNDSDEDLGGHSRSQHIASSNTTKQPSKGNELPASNTLPIRNNSTIEGKPDQALKSRSKDKKKFAKLRKLFGKD